MALPIVVLAAGLARRYGGCKPLAPIGPHGEAVLDLLVSDGLAAGFGEVVLVLHPETGPAIRYHVERTWPSSVEVRYVEQSRPLGTVHAVLAAEPALERGRPFGVCNADDVYGEVAMRVLAEQLQSGTKEHVLVAYRLESTVATGDPVTRGICSVDETGHLTGLQERRQVARSSVDEFTANDGVEPKVLAPELPTSVNLWGFRSAVWDVLHDAMDASGLEAEGGSGPKKAGEAPKAEVLLPEVVASMVTGGTGLPVRVVTITTKLLGVTHAADLPVVSAELARQVACGIRPTGLWGAVD